MAKESQKLYNPKTAFGNKTLLKAINAEQAEKREKRAITKCQLCDDWGRRDLACPECNGRGTLEVECEHRDDQEL